MYKQLIDKLKNTLNNLDKKNVKILKYGLLFCFFILIVSLIILITYLFFIHNHVIYEIGILIFETSLYYAIYFFATSITIDSIQKYSI